MFFNAKENKLVKSYFKGGHVIEKAVDQSALKAIEDIAGPGHKPIIPHPIPNKEDPKINFLSICVFVGNWNAELKKGLFLFLNK